MIPSGAKVRLLGGEKDGDDFDAPEDWDLHDPPLHVWVTTALGEREISNRRYVSPERARALTTCAYRLFDHVVHPSGRIVELHYERDQAADRPIADPPG